jgi:hypothetical protein
MNEVDIGSWCSEGKDEVYCMWYGCPKCHSGSVRSADKYCSQCGVKLNWKENNNGTHN